MSKTRDEMIKEILEHIEDWDIDTLIAYAQGTMNTLLVRLSDTELEQEYKFWTEK